MSKAKQSAVYLGTLPCGSRAPRHELRKSVRAQKDGPASSQVTKLCSRFELPAGTQLMEHPQNVSHIFN